jgi:hypothetical protein
MSTKPMPAALRERVVNDLQPVLPIHPVWRRTLVVAAAATFVMAVTVFGLKLQLRSDIDMLPVWLAWGCTVVGLMVGVLIVGLALREAVPGAAPPAGLARTAVTTGLAIQILVGITTWMHSPGMPLGTDWFAKSVGCLAHDATLVLPTFVVTLWLVFRAMPLRAPTAGLLGGVGAAITGDAINHLLCPMSDLRHVLVWHTGAILGFLVLGWIAGLLWERMRWRP